MGTAQPVVNTNSYPSFTPWEGAVGPALSPEGEDSHASRAMTTHNPRSPNEAYSLRTIPVWVKAQGKKVKVNAILHDASNETFLNEEVAGALGLKESYQTVKVHVLNNSVETFQTMPLKVEIESVNGQFTKEIEVKTCPRNVWKLPSRELEREQRQVTSPCAVRLCITSERWFGRFVDRRR